MWSRIIADPLRGRTPLWKVIWIYGFGVSVIYTLAAELWAQPGVLGEGLNLLIGLVIGVLQSIMLWQCAYNTRSKSRFWGNCVRGSVVVAALMVMVTLYVIWKHPELLEVTDDILKMPT